MKVDDCSQDLPEAFKFLRRMVEVNSHFANPEGVNEVGRIVADQFAPMGFVAQRVETSRPEWGDHWFLMTPCVEGKPTIALVSHLDTVFPADEERRNGFSWREEGEKIHGPGTNDIKGGTALAWMTLEALRREVPEDFGAVNWIVALNACEEVDSADFGQACRRLLPADTSACLVLEADGGVRGDHRVVVQRKGRATFRIDVEGRGAHAGSKHHVGANAIVELSRVLLELAGLTDYERGITVNVGTVTGGSGINRVPHHASAQLEMRAWNLDDYESTKASILGVGGEGVNGSHDGFLCRIHAAVTDEMLPWPDTTESRRLAAFWLDAARDLGMKLETQARGGLSDANVLWESFPTLDGLGPCGDFAHCSE